MKLPTKRGTREKIKMVAAAGVEATEMGVGTVKLQTARRAGPGRESSIETGPWYAN